MILILLYIKIKSIEPGVVYSGGNIKDFARLTGWRMNTNVLYFGDHLYSDLAKPTEEYGWKTVSVALRKKKKTNK